MVILCDISAWEYLRTPPQVRAVELTANQLRAADVRDSPILGVLEHQRSNAREAEACVARRLLTDLKGVSLPVHVMLDRDCGHYHGRIIHAHRIPKAFPMNQLVSLGGGLYIPSPELVLLAQCQHRSWVQVAKMMYEACGTFSLSPGNPRVDLAIRALESAGLVAGGFLSGAQTLYGFCDVRGGRLASVSSDDETPWAPSYDRKGRLTNLWSRPPLTSGDLLSVALSHLSGLRYLDVSRRALRVLLDGAASPAEAQLCLLLFSSARDGGQGWETPLLNARIDYADEAKRLAGRSFAVADMFWRDGGGILEVNGRAYHSDADGFFVETGRTPALESMGYRVAEITPQQMADLELFEVMLPVVAEKLGFGLRRETATFLAARKKLHTEVFRRPYEPVWDNARRLKNHS